MFFEGRRLHGRGAALGLFALLLGGPDAQAHPPDTAPPEPVPSSSPSPAVAPTPSPKRLRLEIDRVVDRLEEEHGKDIPRFETRVEVTGKAPQVMLDRFLHGIEKDCKPGGAPPGGGAPTHVEMREARGHATPSADVLALLRLLAGALKGRGEEKYFLYRVNAKGRVSYLLREGRIPDAMVYAAPGTSFELIKGYADAKSGANGLRRLERGYATPEGPSAPPPAAWQVSTCPPP
jgi:hypothetical protein